MIKKLKPFFLIEILVKDFDHITEKKNENILKGALGQAIKLKSCNKFGFLNFKGRRAANKAKTQKSHPEYFNGQIFTPGIERGFIMSSFKYLPNKKNTFSNFKGHRAANIAKTQKSHPEYLNGRIFTPGIDMGLEYEQL